MLSFISGVEPQPDMQATAAAQNPEMNGLQGVLLAAERERYEVVRRKCDRPLPAATAT